MERRRAYSFKCRVPMLVETVTSTSQVSAQDALSKSDYCAFDAAKFPSFVIPRSRPIRSQAVCDLNCSVLANTFLGFCKLSCSRPQMIYISSVTSRLYPISQHTLKPYPFPLSPQLKTSKRWATIQLEARKLNRIISSPRSRPHGRLDRVP